MGPDSVATRIAAWAGVLARASPQVKSARRLEAFTSMFRSGESAPRQAGPADGMVLLARGSPRTGNGPAEEPARTGERGAEDGHRGASVLSEVDPEAVADRVYRLMQRDLVLGRERTGRPGGQYG